MDELEMSENENSKEFTFSERELSKTVNYLFFINKYVHFLARTEDKNKKMTVNVEISRNKDIFIGLKRILF